MSKEQRKIFIQLDEIDFQLRKQWDEAGNESIDWQMKEQIWRNIKNKQDNKNRRFFQMFPKWQMIAATVTLLLITSAGLWFAKQHIFYARGVLETVKKLRWTPTVVHCHGWFTAVVPVYLKRIFADDPIFRDVKVVVSLYGDGFSGELDPGFGAKIAGEGVKDKNLAILDTPSYENLCRFVMEYADGVVAASPDVDPKVLDMARASGKPMLEYQSPEAEDFFDNYNRFYEAIQ